jgi:hypothetical protein
VLLYVAVSRALQELQELRWTRLPRVKERLRFAALGLQTKKKGVARRKIMTLEIWMLLTPCHHCLWNWGHGGPFLGLFFLLEIGGQRE